MRRLSLALLAATLVALAAGASHARANDDDRPDAWITLKTRLALMTTDGIDTWDLNVDTNEGLVTLHGKVADEDARAKAESVTREIKGVKGVKNLLQVVAPPARDGLDESDDEIEARVEDALDEEPSLEESSIEVASVNKGVVLLKGTAASMAAHLKAVEIARGVPGVRRVATDVKGGE